jgi:hypothetical protein
MVSVVAVAVAAPVATSVKVVDGGVMLPREASPRVAAIDWPPSVPDLCAALTVNE